MKEIETKYSEYSEGVKNYLYTREELESFSTVKLVSFMHNHHYYRSDGFRTSPDFDEFYHKEIIGVEIIWGDNTILEYRWALEKDLREILSTRPNIPNKQQKKQKLKAKIAENRKKVKRKLSYNR